MKQHEFLCTDFLFSASTFNSGLATNLNLAGNFYEFNTSNAPEQADLMAIKRDFEMVGNDLQEAMKASILKNLLSVNEPVAAK